MQNMRGKLCIVTGANRGIGFQTTKGLAEQKATVVMVCRDLLEGQKSLEKIKSITGNQSLYLMYCDVSSMKSIQRFTKEFTNRFTCLNVLINNAGALYSLRETTEEGYEKTIATNYLGSVYLTNSLLPMLEEKTPSRIINLGSITHHKAKIDWNDIMFNKNYNSKLAYANSKLMLITYTKLLAMQLRESNITANLVQPGFVATDLGLKMDNFWDRLGFLVTRPIQISPEKATETIIWAAIDPDLEKITGKTFYNKKEIKTSIVTYDENFQEKLWQETLIYIRE
jgi:retinol dehydrogenase 13